MADDTKSFADFSSSAGDTKPPIAEQTTKTETVSPVTGRSVEDDVAIAGANTKFQANAPELTTGSNASDRLRAFEDREFGKDVVRIQGRIERGSGSPFRNLPEPKQREYTALERCVETELVLSDAESKAAQAKADHDIAMHDADTAADDAAKADDDNAAGK